MPKPRVSDDERRIVISARVKPRVRDTLLEVGSGNISRAVEELVEATYPKSKPAASAAVAN